MTLSALPRSALHGLRDRFSGAFSSGQYQRLTIHLAYPQVENLRRDAPWLSSNFFGSGRIGESLCTDLPLFGEPVSVEEFRRLAVNASALLPNQFKHFPPLYPQDQIELEGMLADCAPVRIWCEFLFVAVPSFFRFSPPPAPEEDWPPSLRIHSHDLDPNRRYGTLRRNADALLASVEAIEQFLLTDDLREAAERYRVRRAEAEAEAFGRAVPEVPSAAVGEPSGHSPPVTPPAASVAPSVVPAANAGEGVPAGTHDGAKPKKQRGRTHADPILDERVEPLWASGKWKGDLEGMAKQCGISVPELKKSIDRLRARRNRRNTKRKK